MKAIPKIIEKAMYKIMLRVWSPKVL